MRPALHVFGDTHHHNPNMIRFLDQVQGGAAAAARYLVGCKAGDDLTAYAGLERVTFYRKPATLFVLLGLLPGRIIFHSLGSGSAWLVLFLRPDLVRRTSWVVWGADFTSARQATGSWKQRFLFHLRQSVARRLQSIAVLTPSDAAAVAEVFDAREVVYCPYPILGLSKEVRARQRPADEPVRVLVGNSAGATNRHIALIDSLALAASDAHCRFVFPLNYAGTPDYVERVMQHAEHKLPGRCEFITGMMSNTAYEAVLDTIDIIVFNHDRQQGLYVVYYGLLGGKKIYLCREASSYQSLTALGAHIAVSNDLQQDGAFATLLDEDEAAHNRSICSSNFTEEACAGRWLSLVAGAQ